MKLFRVTLLSLQIQLLLQYLKSDPRKAVKRLTVQDLKLLANKTPHTWSKENIQVHSASEKEILNYLSQGGTMRR